MALEYDRSSSCIVGGVPPLPSSTTSATRRTVFAQRMTYETNEERPDRRIRRRQGTSRRSRTGPYAPEERVFI
jgi:hypothetical protein